jgi:hypothetical protein
MGWGDLMVGENNLYRDMKYIRLLALEYILSRAVRTDRWTVDLGDFAKGSKLTKIQSARALGDLGKILPIHVQFFLEGGECRHHYLVGKITLEMASDAFRVVLRDEHSWTSWGDYEEWFFQEVKRDEERDRSGSEESFGGSPCCL